jgi:3-hydroxyacyl-CoA dehydrogenase/enoyl-CoA hydratase/3-hydroxybutyryl-CoA epimerase
MSDYLRLAEENGVLLVTLDDPSGRANRTTAQFKDAFGALLDRIGSTHAMPRGLILLSAKASFGTGGDIAEILGEAGRGRDDSFADSQRLKALFRRVERLGCPIVALIEGTAAGGGWELALACHARFSLPGDTIRLGLPEVTLGLVPGGGGLQRLPHRLGARAAGRLIAQGLLQTPSAAMAEGLIDGLAPDRAALVERAMAFIAANPTPVAPWDRPGHRPPDCERHDGPIADTQAARLALDAIGAIAAAVFDDGAAIESELFARCATSSAARALIGLRFVDRNTLRRRPVDPAWSAAFTERLRETGPSPEAQARAALGQLRANAVLSAAAANVASIEAGFPAEQGGVLRFIATGGLGPLAAEDERRLAAVEAADLGILEQAAAG